MSKIRLEGEIKGGSQKPTFAVRCKGLSNDLEEITAILEATKIGDESDSRVHVACPRLITIYDGERIARCYTGDIKDIIAGHNMHDEDTKNKCTHCLYYRK